jgi:5-methyltetrahydrofolate--homocysteine methyltransferase
MFDKLLDAMTNMREQESIDIVNDLLSSGEDPLQILDTCTRAMETVGERFESGEYFLPELIMAGEILKQVSERVKPKLQVDAGIEKSGRVLIGTVKGDIHDIGKDIVTFLLDVNGFEVKDIGIDVPIGKFIQEIETFQPQVVGLSGLLTLAYDAMKETIEAIARAGYRDKVKIMIGGGQMSEKVCEYVGADAYGKDAVAGVTLTKNWLGATNS